MAITKKTYGLLVSLSILLLPPICSLAQETKHLPLTRHIKDSLKVEIEAMLTNDQKFRWQLEFGETDSQKIETYKNADDDIKFKRIKDVLDHKVGITKAQNDSLENIQESIDSANFIKLARIIHTYGFPHKYIPSYKPTTILSHAPEGLMDAIFLNTLREEVLLGNLEAIEYARLYDKVQLERHLPELYYVNDHYDPMSRKTAVGVPSNLNVTNKAREEIGLKKYSSEQ